MSERQAQIAEMANLVSDRIFKQFGWKRRPHKDQDWDCVTKRHQKPTHPSDIVFHYESPFPKEGGRIYINTDLKSYAKGTIKKEKLEEALTSLSQATECANKSQSWQDLYLDPTHNARVHGMLFIYNHDNEYDRDFVSLLKSVKVNLLKVRPDYRIYIFGPNDIEYLYNIAVDIALLRNDKLISKSELCRFYLPDMVKARVSHKEISAATPEMLKMPWQIIKYESDPGEVDLGGYLIYYRGLCESSDELKYFLDFLFRFQLVEDSSQICIRAPYAHENATAFFETAKEQYAERYFGYKDFETRLDRISLSVTGNHQATFSTKELGMDSR